MTGTFDAEKNKFLIQLDTKESTKVELSHEELEKLLENKLDEINFISDLLYTYPLLIKE
jgi:hypothetical protein